MFRWLAILCLGLLFLPRPSQADEPIPVEYFAELPSFSDPDLSPDGNYIAAKLAVEGKQYFGILSLFDTAAKPVLIQTGEVDLDGWQWINDDWLVLNVSATTRFFGFDIRVRRIITVSRDGKTINRPGWNEAAQDAGDVLWIARDGKPELLLAMRTSIYSNYPGFWPMVVRVDATNGRTRQDLRSFDSIMHWYADADGLVRMGVGFAYGGRKMRLVYRDRDGQMFRTVDRADSRKDESLLMPAMFLGEPGKAVAFSDKDGFDALYELDLTSLTLGKRLFGVDGHDVDGLVADETRTNYQGFLVTRQRTRIEWTDPAMAAIQRDIDAALGPTLNARIVSRSRDTDALIVQVSDADWAGAYYWYHPAAGVMKRLAWVNGRFKGQRLAPVRTISYKARDGLEISAVLTLPRNREAKALPLIVLPHGGPAWRDKEEWDWWVQFLASRGYAVIQPNYRGSSGYGRAFLDKGEGQWGLAMQDDLNDAITHLASEGIADSKRVCIAGGSYGGYAAMRAAQRDGALYRCAISFAGVSSLPGMLSYDRRFLSGRRSEDGWREAAPDLRSVSPLYHPQDFSTPILIVHGKKDLRVPVKQSREMVEKLREAGKPVDYIEQREGDHHFSREVDRLQFLQAMEAFLAKHNPA